jgi:hypothetical protein
MSFYGNCPELVNMNPEMDSMEERAEKEEA